MTDRTPAPEPPGEPEPGLSRLAIGLLVLAVVVTVAGGALMVWSWVDGDAAPVQTNAEPDGSPFATGFAETPEGGSGSRAAGADAAPTDDWLDEWSPTIFRFGFSFVIGFCIAYAVRSFLKIAALIAGVILLAIFGLQYAGVLDVDWSRFSGEYDSLVAWLREQTSGFVTFVKGYVPSAASAGAGMIAGFRRK